MEKKRQQSPMSSPPRSRSLTPVQDIDSANSFAIDVDHAEKIQEISPLTDSKESNNQQENIEKPEGSTSTFLGLQPFGRNKNKGYRPISFNPSNSKLAQPVS